MTLAATWGQLSWRALDWVYLSGQVGVQARLPVVVAAGAAALAAARFTRPSLVFAQPWQPRMERDLPLRQATVVTGWCLAAYLVGLLPLAAAVAAQGAGVPQPVPILGALTGFAALTLLGYLCGVALRGPIAVPVAIGLVFMCTSMPLLADAWTALSLQLPFTLSLGNQESVALSFYRLGFFLLLVTAAAWTTAWLLRAPHGWSAPQITAVAAVAIAAVLPHLYVFPLVTYAPGGSEVCAERDGIRYCVHEGHADELTLIVELAAPVFAAYGPSEALPAQVRDRSLATEDDDVLYSEEHGVLWARVYPGWDPYQQVSREAAVWLVPGPWVCGSEGVGSTDVGATPEQRRMSALLELETWLASRPFPDSSGDGSPAEATPDPDEVRDWISRNEERIAACEVEPEELPWQP
ncbi:ABC transporter permease [Nocardiopsis valliformis]|uniref:ABC transporter permease n=1 Tax=Nocardiopsis valliformis TaxID=239974 RepID=UPI001EF9D332|nr:ABC transporter permease [Nocardiopsis valliformis]